MESIPKGRIRGMRNMSGVSFLFYKGSHRCKGLDPILYTMAKVLAVAPEEEEKENRIKRKRKKQQGHGSAERRVYS